MGRRTFTSIEEFRAHYETNQSVDSATRSVDYAAVSFGGRSKNASVETIVANNLFLFKFEATYVHDYLRAYKHYVNNNVEQKYSTLKTELRDISINLIDNCGVNPIECMLYASKDINSRLSDLKLLRTIGEVVKMLYDRLGHKVYTETLFHIVRYWGKWESQIKICIMASSKSMEYDLIEYIFNNFFDNLFYKVEVFDCIMDSKRELFIPSILEIIYGLNNEGTDRIIGNLFKRKFSVNFSEYDINKYIKTLPIPQSHYVRQLLQPFLDANNQNSLIQKMEQATTDHDKKRIIDEAILALKKVDCNKKDIIYVFSISKLDYAGYQLLSILTEKEFKSDQWQPTILIDCIMCFAHLKYSNAADKIEELSKMKNLKGAARIALCILGEIDVEILVRNYIQEIDKKILDSYKKGFSKTRRDINFVTQVRKKLLETFQQVLSVKDEMFISTSIRNILDLIKIDIAYYHNDLFEVIKELFGFKGQSQVKIKMQEQIYLLDIVELVINNNKQRFYDFLFYVEKGNVNIKETVKQRANTILNNKFPMENMGKL